MANTSSINHIYTDITTIEGNCTHGDVRLTGKDDPVALRRNGTVEVCINNAWGTVCNDNYFDVIEAEAVCQQVAGFTSEGKQL